MSRTARPRSVTPRAAGSGGSLSPATSDAGRSNQRPASPKLPPPRATAGISMPTASMRHAIEPGQTLSDHCLGCGRPVRPWEKQLRISGAVLHHACGTYKPRDR